MHINSEIWHRLDHTPKERILQAESLESTHASEETVLMVASSCHLGLKRSARRRATNSASSIFNINLLQLGVTFLHPLKTSENLKVFWCFQGL